MGSGLATIQSGDDPIDGPNPEVNHLGLAAALDSIGINWDVLTDTNFAVDYEDVWPPWGSCGLPWASATVTRFNGNVTTPGSVCGKGVLIVTGDFTAAAGFQWNGILLAGHIVTTNDNFRIDGLVVGGLDGNGSHTRSAVPGGRKCRAGLRLATHFGCPEVASCPRSLR